MELFLVVYFLLEFPGRGEHFYLLGVIFLPGHSQTLKGTTFFSEILLVLPFLFMPILYSHKTIGIHLVDLVLFHSSPPP